MVYLTGVEVLRQNIEANAIVDSTTFATVVVGDAAVTGPFALGVVALLPGTNVLAVEVHQANAGSSDIVWGGELVLGGTSLAAFTPGAPNNVAGSTASLPPVFLSEVVPNNTGGIRDGAGEREPGVELVNQGSEPVSLAGWALSDSFAQPARWTFPAGAVLAPGERRVVFLDGEAAEGTSTEWHASFRPTLPSGVVVLGGPGATSVVVADYLAYSGALPDMAYVLPPVGVAGITVAVAPTPGEPNAGAVNRPPVFVPVPSLSATVGGRLLRTLEATDPDLPAQALTFSRVSGPTGATVSSGGVLDWTPTAAQVGRHVVRAEVRDSGVPPASAFMDITIDVVTAPALVLQVVQGPAGITLSWASATGTRYRLESSTALGGAWTTVSELLANGSTTSAVVVPGAEAVRLYRVQVVP